MKNKLVSILLSLVMILILSVGLLGVIFPISFALAEQTQQFQVKKNNSSLEEASVDCAEDLVLVPLSGNLISEGLKSKDNNQSEAATKTQKTNQLTIVVCSSDADCQQNCPSGCKCNCRQKRCRQKCP